MIMNRQRAAVIGGLIAACAFLLVAAVANPQSPAEVHRLNEEAVSLAAQERYEAAYEKITRANQLAGGDEVVRDNRVTIGAALASRWFEQGKRQEAIDLLESLRDLGGERQDALLRQLAVTYNNYGVFLGQREQYEEADRACSRATHLAYTLGEEDLLGQVSKVRSQMLTAWAQEWLLTGKGETAKIKLLEALRYDEGNVGACDMLAKIYFDDGDYRQAEYYLRRAVTLRPDDPELRRRLQRVQSESRLDSGLPARKRGKFRVEFSGREEYELSREVFEILDDARKELGRLFDFYPAESLLVKIYNAEHSDALGYGPEWAAAVYDGKIRVRADDIRRGGSALRDVLYHEYAHAVLHYLTRHNIPTWLNEGLAQYAEPGESISLKEERAVRHWLDRGRYIPMARLEGTFVEMDAERAQQVYTESKLFAAFLVEGFGEYKLRSLLRALGQGLDVEEAAREAYGQSMTNLEIQWIDNIARS